ncbi:MAG: hypothetical protein ACRDVG_07690 [Jatrophihabitantaceae bacterium]
MGTSSSQVDSVRNALAYGALGFGALAVAAPKVFAGLYGLKGDGNLGVMIRLWGTSTAALGALNLIANDDGQKRTLATVATALNAADTVLIATAGSEVSARSRVMGTVTTAAFCAAGAYVLSQS